MKVRTDFHSIDLANGTKTRSVVGDGERVDETIGRAEPSGEPYEYDPRVEGVSSVISNRTPAPDWAEKEARELVMEIFDWVYWPRDTQEAERAIERIAALLRRVREEGEKANRDAIDAHVKDYPDKGDCEWHCRTMSGYNQFEEKVRQAQQEEDAKLVEKLSTGVLEGMVLKECANPIMVSEALKLLAAAIRKGER